METWTGIHDPCSKTGNIDDQYEIKSVEEDDNLILFQTWDDESNEEEMYLVELSYDQLKEIFYELENK